MLLLTKPDYLESWFTLQSSGLDFHWSSTPEPPGTFIFRGTSVPSYTAPFQTGLGSKEVTSSGEAACLYNFPLQTALLTEPASP